MNVLGIIATASRIASEEVVTDADGTFEIVLSAERPEGDVTYHLQVADGRATFAAGRASKATTSGSLATLRSRSQARATRPV